MNIPNLIRCAVSMLLLSAFSNGMSQPVYKHTDGQGHVSYSSVPPVGKENVEELRLPPGPDEAQQQRAREQEAAIEQAMEEKSKEMEMMAKERKEAQEKQQAAPPPSTVLDEMLDSYGYRPVNRPQPPIELGTPSAPGKPGDHPIYAPGAVRPQPLPQTGPGNR